MSYRTFKRTLGETNLERKCRLLFGACLFPLIAGSFWWYGTQTDQIVVEQNQYVGEAIVDTAMVLAHKDILSDPVIDFQKKKTNSLDKKTNDSLAKLLRKRDFDWVVLRPKNEEGIGNPTETEEFDLIDRWSKVAETLKKDKDIDALNDKEFVGEIKLWEGHFDKEKVVYRYYEPVFSKNGCLVCHRNPAIPVSRADLETGDLLAIVKVEIDAKDTLDKQDDIRSMLWVAAIAAVFLAMVALYAIVRYVIVKPLRHLRDVSNAIRQGEVDKRATIHTGDEFEELGEAFNRMLRQLLRQQDELRVVNTELDGKIDEMAHANMRLFEMNQLKSDFLATVSHELRTPLNSIIGFSDLLEGGEGLEKKQRRYANNIQRAGKQLLEMINDILDLAKIENGKLEVHPSTFGIGTIVATQCDMAQPLSQKKNIDLEYDVSPGLPPMRLDQGKIVQILNNLLSNAIKFTPDGGRINITVRRDEQGDLRLTVADTGVGISESEQQLVFEKFRQGTTVMPGGNAMTREYSGTGLGLSIVRELCRLMGGDITLQSELGRGSEFTVHLPWTLSELPKVESPLAKELLQMTKPRPELSAALPTVETPQNNS
ncbi:MAG: HAMP domain-containing protein [Planctomycetes bacterium]|nr:HAMP domain-containing protein [Planctomycetota bacterium]